MKSLELIQFYKENGKWYADVRGHSKAENLMVAGSDKFLQVLLEHNTRLETPYNFDDLLMSVTVNKPEEKEYLFELKRLFHDKFGATYLIRKNKKSWIHFEEKIPRFCWLCNVVHTVFGEHPKHIYILNV